MNRKKKEFASDFLKTLSQVLRGWNQKEHITTRELKNDLGMGSDTLNNLSHGKELKISVYSRYFGCLLEWRNLEFNAEGVIRTLKRALEFKMDIVITVRDRRSNRTEEWVVVMRNKER